MRTALQGLYALPIDGTAVGTGLNSHPDFAKRAIASLARRTGHPFEPAPDRFAALAGQDRPEASHAGAVVRPSVKLLAVAVVAGNPDYLAWLATTTTPGPGA